MLENRSGKRECLPGGDGDIKGCARKNLLAVNQWLRAKFRACQRTSRRGHKQSEQHLAHIRAAIDESMLNPANTPPPSQSVPEQSITVCSFLHTLHLSRSSAAGQNSSDAQHTPATSGTSKNRHKKAPTNRGFLKPKTSGFSQLLFIFFLILNGERLLLLVVQQLPGRLKELLLFFLEMVMNLLRQLLGRRQP